MSNIGSLTNFLTIPQELCKTTEFLTPKGKSGKKNSTVLREKPLPSNKFSRNLSALTQYDQNTEGYIYVSVHKDLSTFMHLHSAAPTMRSTEKPQKAFKASPKTVKSRISSRRDPRELQVPIPKTVKMQEKIRNELL